jgi:FAD/FMN-containing dehydrogenase
MDWTRRGEPDYERRRRGAVWNELVPDRFPDAIASPSSREEVTPAVAGATGRIAVKSGGHNWLGASLREGGVLLDLGGLDAVEVDVEARVARVEPGATHKVLADALVPHGLAFPIGHCPSVGLGGYLLAGGFGWNPRTWGPACWSVAALDVVTAAGEQLRVGADSHPDLYWAARGGGPGFRAIVTRFHLELQQLPTIVGRRIAFRADAIPALMRWTSETLAALPPGIEISLIVRRPWSGDDRDLRVTVVATAFRPTRAAAEELLAAALGDLPLPDRIVSRSDPEELALNELEGEGGWHEGLRYAADTCWVSDGLEEVGAAIEQAMRAAPSPLTRAVVAFGAHGEPRPDVALSRLGSDSVNFYATWERPADDEANVAWVRRSMDAVAPWADGHYVGETDLTADPGRARACYSAEAWTRLEQVAAEYDPDRRLAGFLAPS